MPNRLYELTKNNGKFWVVVFAGEPPRTAEDVKALRACLDSADSFTKRLANALEFLTIIAGTGLLPDETLGVERFGRTYYDVDHAGHARYGTSRPLRLDRTGLLLLLLGLIRRGRLMSISIRLFRHECRAKDLTEAIHATIEHMDPAVS